MIGPFEGKYEFLSNFYDIYKNHDICITYNGIGCDSTEHAYQAAKSTTYEDFLYVMNSKSPADAKKRGREIKCRPDWNKAKFNVMYEVLKRKFDIPELKKLLVETGKEELVELNWWGDEIFGVNEKNGKGDNKLGKILMKIRKEITGHFDEPPSTGLGKILTNK